MSMAAENPRAVIGSNSGARPRGKGKDRPPTIEEATQVAKAILYVQTFAPNLEDVLVKRKGGRKMGWRLSLAWALKDIVPLIALYQLLQLNRKTAGENQQRPERWAEEDDAIDENLAKLREGIFNTVTLDWKELDVQLGVWVKQDPVLRDQEEQRRSNDLTKKRMLAVAAEIEEADRVRRAKALKKKLKGVKAKDAIEAKHIGAETLAKSLSDDAIDVLAVLAKKEAKGLRPDRSTLDPIGLKECLKRELARVSVPHLSPPVDDPPIGITQFGARVCEAAIAMGRIKARKKPKPATT